MTIKAISTGDKLTETIKGNKFKAELALLDAHLQEARQSLPFEFAMKAFYELASTGDKVPFFFDSIWLDFITALRRVLLTPATNTKFMEVSGLTEQGVEDYVNLLEAFLHKMQDKTVKADLFKIGLLEFPENYEGEEARDWGGTSRIIKDFS